MKMSQSRLEVPPNISLGVLQKLQTLVASVRAFIINQQRRTTVNPELEIRLGNILEGRFSTDVGVKVWTQIISAMDASSEWSGVMEEKEIVDFFYKGENNKMLRTSRFIGAQGNIEKEHMFKERQNMCMLNVHGIPYLLNGTRVSFSSETSIPAEDLPDITITEKVRIKYRRSYTWGDWRYDLSKVWTGNTLQAAMRLRDDQEKSTENATYEVEIECVNSILFFDKQAHTDEYIALSIALKIIGLLPENIMLQV